MKDIGEKAFVGGCDVSGFGIEETLERIDAALHFLWGDKTISIHDKVAGDYDFEELLAVLLAAKFEMTKTQPKSLSELIAIELNPKKKNGISN